MLATGNGHKVRELRTLLADLIEELDLEIVGMGAVSYTHLTLPTNREV